MKIREVPLLAGQEHFIPHNNVRLYGPGTDIFTVLQSYGGEGTATFYHGYSIHIVDLADAQGYDALFDYLVEHLPLLQIMVYLPDGEVLEKTR